MAQSEKQKEALDALARELLGEEPVMQENSGKESAHK